MIGTAAAQVYDIDQVIMRPTSYDDSLPLEIEPLITSGDPSNRVDLVFFADGCKFCSCDYHLRLRVG